ncbi:glycosyltransferase family 4 protein [Arthrobacter sp. NPDC097144]|uniref:glycosyltransferase family 4 protein n=1 Tax=Arthrobacter sp. NPDC097144 TaxID=3363946 RepID=UPI00381E8772
MKVLVIGDPPGTPGGIAQVMTLLDSWCDAQHEIKVNFLNPLGKKDPSGTPSLRSFFGALVHMGRSEIVHFNTASNGSTYRNIIFSLVSRTLRIPYIIHLHGGGYAGFLQSLHPWQLRLVLSYFQHAETVIALTPGWSKFISNQLKVSTAKITVIPNGTADPGEPLARTAQKSQTPTFVYAGRLTKAKGVPELIRAFRALPMELNAKLILIGSEIDSLVSNELNKGSENISQLGWRENTETLAKMAAAWAVVLPSHFENMPLTVLESMSVSTAVIATRVGGIPEVVRDNLDGILIPPGDTDALMRSMTELCNFKQAVEYGSRGRVQWLQKYTSERMSASIVDQWSHAKKK